VRIEWGGGREIGKRRERKKEDKYLGKVKEGEKTRKLRA
jgi:hypothetical protein